MDCHFAEMDVKWFERAHYYSGSIEDRDRGLDFRFRYEQTVDNGARALKVSTYSKWCYEKAEDVEECLFPWTEEGVAALKAWLQSRYEAYLAAHT